MREKDPLDDLMASTRLFLYLLWPTQSQTILVTRVFTHPLGTVLHGPCQEICQYKVLAFLYLVPSKHTVFRAVLNRLRGSLVFCIQNACECGLISMSIFSCNHVLRIPLTWPWLVREYQSLSPPGHWFTSQSRLDQWPTEGYHHLTAVGWVTWQGLLSRSYGHLSKADWFSFQLLEQRWAEMTENKRSNCMTEIIQYLLCNSKMGSHIPFEKD